MKILNKIRDRKNKKYYIQLENGKWYLAKRKKIRRAVDRTKLHDYHKKRSTIHVKSVYFTPVKEIQPFSDEFVKLRLTYVESKVPILLLLKFSKEEIVKNIMLLHEEDPKLFENALYCYSKTIDEILNNYKIEKYNKKIGCYNVKKIIRDGKSWIDVSTTLSGKNYYSVSGLNRNYYFQQHVKFLTNEEISDLDLISEILWEVTFNGFVEFESEQFYNELNETFKEIMK